MRSIEMAQLIAAAVAVGVPLETMPLPPRKPERVTTEADALRISQAQAKRDRRATQRIARHAGKV